MTGRRGEPVFVDSSGRRRWVATVCGTALGVGLLVSLGLILAGFFGGGPVPLPGLPGSSGDRARAAAAQPMASTDVVTAGRSGAPAPNPQPAAAPPPQPPPQPAITPTPTPTPTPSPTTRRAGPPAGHGRPSKSR
jgi:hypothetical protein